MHIMIVYRSRGALPGVAAQLLLRRAPIHHTYLTMLSGDHDRIGVSVVTLMIDHLNSALN